MNLPTRFSRKSSNVTYHFQGYIVTQLNRITRVRKCHHQPQIRNFDLNLDKGAPYSLDKETPEHPAGRRLHTCVIHVFSAGIISEYAGLKLIDISTSAFSFSPTFRLIFTGAICRIWDGRFRIQREGRVLNSALAVVGRELCCWNWAKTRFRWFVERVSPCTLAWRGSCRGVTASCVHLHSMDHWEKEKDETWNA